jgi:signal peptidase I
MGNDTITVLSDTQRLPADGRSYTVLHLASSSPVDSELQLRIRGLGSFDPHIRRRSLTVPLAGGEARVAVFAPRNPGAGVITGGGIHHRLQFYPSSVAQGLVWDWLPTLGLALAFALLVRGYAFATFYIPSGSMRDTLTLGDQFIADKFSYRVLHEQPRRGDIVVFRHPSDTRGTWVKRVIGLPGDVIEVRDFTVYVNGEALNEDYVRERPWQDFGPVTVPQDKYFVMGDNRNNSEDSRSWGFLPRSHLLGRALMVYWPPSHARILPREDVGSSE